VKFNLINTDNKARRGTMVFDRGEVETPAFMPVGTYGTVKAMTPEEVSETGAQIILGNTFHLDITPGTDVIEAHGDLHDFMHWQGRYSQILAVFRYSVWAICARSVSKAWIFNHLKMVIKSSWALKNPCKFKKNSVQILL